MTYDPGTRKSPPFLARTLTDLRTLFSEYGWLLLSHHPRCPTFSGTTMRFGKFELCRGCVLGYSTFAVVMFLVFSGLVRNTGTTLFIAALIAGGLGAIGLGTRSNAVAWCSDVCRGLALGCGLSSILKSRTILEASLFTSTLAAVAITYLALRFYLLQRRCQRCEFHIHMPDCPGLLSPY